MTSKRLALVSSAAAVAVALTGCNLVNRIARPDGSIEATPPPVQLPVAVPVEGDSPSSIYQSVAPSVVYIETDWGTGSGFVVAVDGDKYVVTNSHVVSPFREVRIVLPDGDELPDAPVVDVDMLADLAVIGPIETNARPLVLSEDVTTAIGSPVYLIGYPGESEVFPQPTLATGLLSNIRRWPAADLTYYQTDASTVGGQSGGVLVAANGDILGVPTFWFGEPGAFGLALSAADALPRITQMIAGEDSDGLGMRGTILGDTDDMQTLQIGQSITGALDYFGDTDVFLIELERGDVVDVAVESIHFDPVVMIGSETATEADLVSDDDSGRGVFGTDALVTYEAETTGTHVIMVQDYGGYSGAYRLSVSRGELE
ncbi:MAG: serine protease [Caldilineales bacterium]